MIDISMCMNKKCVKRKRCYRFMAKPDELRQSYAEFKPSKDGYCDGFWKMTPERKDIQLKGEKSIKDYVKQLKNWSLIDKEKKQYKGDK